MRRHSSRTSPTGHAAGLRTTEESSPKDASSACQGAQATVLRRQRSRWYSVIHPPRVLNPGACTVTLALGVQKIKRPFATLWVQCRGSTPRLAGLAARDPDEQAAGRTPGPDAALAGLDGPQRS